MLYKSTRDKNSNTRYSFKDALFGGGYAPDNGLLVPDTIPQLSAGLLETWKRERLSYQQVVGKVVRLFIAPSELSDEEIKTCVQQTYAYPKKFRAADIIPVRTLHWGRDNCNGNGKSVLQVAELFHGPTGSFKDLALSLVGSLMERFLTRKGVANGLRHVTLLVATTGDTGSAAIEAVRGSNCMDILVLYPKGRVSKLQEAHMRSMCGSKMTHGNVHLYEVEATNDELDVPVRELIQSQPESECSRLVTVNSINWARVMIQIAHHVYLYLHESVGNVEGHSEAEGGGQVPEHLDLVIPTGAAGNLAAAVYATRMGVPLRVHVATNANDCLTVCLSTGILDLSKPALLTAASAMDVACPLNVERVLHAVIEGEDAGGAGTIVAQIMQKGQEGPVHVPAAVMQKLRKVVVGCMTVTDEAIYEAIQRSYKENQFVHKEATALVYAGTHLLSQHSKTPIFILSTAANYKFPEVGNKLGIPPAIWNQNNQFIGLVGLGPDAKGQSLDLEAFPPTRSMKRNEAWLSILKSDC